MNINIIHVRDLLEKMNRSRFKPDPKVDALNVAKEVFSCQEPEAETVLHQLERLSLISWDKDTGYCDITRKGINALNNQSLESLFSTEEVKSSSDSDKSESQNQAILSDFSKVIVFISKRKYLWTLLASLFAIFLGVFTLRGKIEKVHREYFNKEIVKLLILPSKKPVDLTDLITKKDLEIFKRELEIQKMKEQLISLKTDSEALKEERDTLSEKVDQLESDRIEDKKRYNSFEKTVRQQLNIPVPNRDGKISVKLFWDAENDLDLYVSRIGSSIIWYSNLNDEWGRLTKDCQNGGQCDEYFQTNHLVDGDYIVKVANYHGPIPVSGRLEVSILENGKERLSEIDEVIKISSQDEQIVVSFSVIKGDIRDISLEAKNIKNK